MNEQQKKRLAARERFLKVRRAERGFAARLNQVAKQVDAIVRGMAPDGLVKDPAQLISTLTKYADLLWPWARDVAQSMVNEVNKRDAKAWAQQASEMGRELRHEIASTPIGETFRELMREQVDLITSLPRGAAERVHQLTTTGMFEGTRARNVQKEILNTGRVTAARAMTIARTETSRTASSLTMARAQHIGSEGYIWRTAGDSDVRPALSLSPRQRAGFVGSHRKLEGKFIRWDSPPVSGQNGERAHAGMIYNCRCYPEVIIPDEV